MRTICGICNKEIILKESSERICESCQNIIDFGYPPFPAYKLKDTGKKNFSIRKKPEK